MVTLMRTLEVPVDVVSLRHSGSAVGGQIARVDGRRIIQVPELIECSGLHTFPGLAWEVVKGSTWRLVV